jgi:hypothetical protein
MRENETYFKFVRFLNGLPGATPDVSFCRRASDGIYRISDNHRDMPEYLEQPIHVT